MAQHNLLYPVHFYLILQKRVFAYQKEPYKGNKNGVNDGNKEVMGGEKRRNGWEKE